MGLENSSDKKIWEFAKSKNFTIVTFDADFYDFLLSGDTLQKSSGLELEILTTKSIEKIIRNHMDSIKNFIGDEELACLEIIN